MSVISIIQPDSDSINFVGKGLLVILGDMGILFFIRDVEVFSSNDGILNVIKSFREVVILIETSFNGST